MHVTVRPMFKLQRVDLHPDKMCKNLGCENTAVNQGGILRHRHVRNNLQLTRTFVEHPLFNLETSG